MFKLRNVSGSVAAVLVLVLSAAAVAFAAVTDLNITNSTAEVVPVTIHCECGYHKEVSVEAFSSTVEQMPSQVTSLWINGTSVHVGEIKYIQLETGSIVKASYIGIDDFSVEQ